MKCIPYHRAMTAPFSMWFGFQHPHFGPDDYFIWDPLAK
jgi:hypothetical protein